MTSLKVQDMVDWLDRFAPFRTAESWDNVGLLWGDPGAEVARVMTCLTVTSETAREAIAQRADLIISHHPVLFRGTKRVTRGEREHGMLWDLARAGVAVVSPHTAFDNADGGINDILCERLGILETISIRPFTPSSLYKVIVFTPEADREAVLSAAFRAGAGRIGAYEECSFSSLGTGTFWGTDATNPTVGEKGRRESVEEHRIEVVSEAERLRPLLLAIRAAHSYEEPAIDVYPLRPEEKPTQGAGRVGRLANPLTLMDFAAKVSRTLNASGLQYVGEASRPIQRVAVVCGAGDDFLADAARAGADVLVTGEARYHRALEAEALGIGLIVAGHHATERLGVEELAKRISGDFADLVSWCSRRENDPLQPLN